MSNEHYDFQSLRLLHRGKVRDIWEAGKDHLLIFTTDRVSVFDNVLPVLIPGRGAILTEITKWWCDRTDWIIPNHISRATLSLDEVLPNAGGRPNACRACQIVRRYTPLPIEAIVRGYLYGSAWMEYSNLGTINGNPYPEGFLKAHRFNYPIFTPTTKEKEGTHDLPLTKQAFKDKVGRDVANRIEDASLSLYEVAHRHLATKGFIMADTKFEFALDEDGQLVLIDEVLTPDGSRIWDMQSYAPGKNQKSYDKQIVRDYISGYIGSRKYEEVKEIPLPQEVIDQTIQSYQKVLTALVK